MKKITLLLLTFFLFALQMEAQVWTENIKAENPSFYDIQKAFNDYWESYNVDNGKYIEGGEEHKAYGWKQFKRWEWYWEQRVGVDGQFPKNTVVWEEWQKQLKSSTNEKSSKLAPVWLPKGPYDKTIHGLGRVNCIAFHPTIANTFWIGTPAGGIWKTTNGGTTWTAVGDNLPVIGVSSIVIHPTNPNIMYVATGDGEGAFSLSAYGASLKGDTKSIGVLKTTDGGLSWTNVLSALQEDGILIRKILIKPNAPDTLYLASNVGVYRTTDGGLNWTNIKSGYFIDIEFKTTNSDTIYASTYSYGGNAQVYRSTNGSSFSQVTSFNGINRINIAVTASDPNGVDLLCSDATNNGLYGLYYSGNSGSTWQKYYDGSAAGHNLLGNKDNGTALGGQGFYDLSYIVDPNNSNTKFVGGVNTFKTTNGGTSWSPSNVWTSHIYYNTTGCTQIVHADKHYFAYHPLVTNTLFECNDGGVFKSTNNGTTWSNITNSIQISQFYSISSSQTDSNIITGGRQDNGSLLMSGNTEYELTGGDGMITQIDYSNSNYIYTSYVRGKIYRIILSPQSVSVISDNIPGQPTGTWLTPFLIDPTSPNILYAGYTEVYKTTNRGNSWTQISNFGGSSKINYLDVAPTNSNYIYAARYNAIYMTSNGGSSWSNITGTLPVSTNKISSITIDPNDPNSLLVTISGYTASQKVFFTNNAGSSWNNVSLTGLPNLPVNCAEVDKYSSDIYLGTDLGVYMFDTVSSGWVQYGSGLPNVVVTDLDIQYSSSKLRVGTFGRGLWEIPLSTPHIVSPVASFSSSTQNICENGCINYMDNSTNNPKAWNWSFPGGTPSSSSQQHPTNICYANAGKYTVSLTVTNSAGNNTKIITNYITVNNCTSINGSEKEDLIQVYPNPNTGNFNIIVKNTSKLQNIRIIDAIGKVVYKNDTKQKNYQIDNLAQGIYIVVISFENAIEYRKVTVY